MLELRQRTGGWIMSPLLAAAVALSGVAVVVVFLLGRHDQLTRQVPSPTSAWVAMRVHGRPAGTSTHLDAGAARQLARIVNNLPHQRDGDTSCGNETGSGYDIVFAVSSGTVEASADLGGCLDVGVGSHGSDWGVDKWDPDDILKAAIRADVKRA